MHDLQGKIRQDGSGFATFKATFQCITFRPFKGEVLDCVVSQVNKVCCVDRQLGAVRGPVRLTWVLWVHPRPASSWWS
jgi:DNA-directed RNA polymerase subunit E'/Rpb7